MKPNLALKMIEVFSMRKNNNASYSMRAFARDLGIEVSLLSRILSGKKKITSKMLLRLSKPLLLTQDEYRLYLNSLDEMTRSQFISEIDEDIFLSKIKFLSEWYYFVILELMKTSDFNICPKWISTKLIISHEEAVSALDKLVVNGLLHKSKDGVYLNRTDDNFILDSNLTDNEMKGRLKHSLQRAIDYVDNCDCLDQDQSGMTMAIDSTLIPIIKKRISLFKKSLAVYIMKNSRKKDRVYEISISMLPW